MCEGDGITTEIALYAVAYAFAGGIASARDFDKIDENEDILINFVRGNVASMKKQRAEDENKTRET